MCAWILALALAACSQPAPAGIPLYERHCAECHGGQASGTGYAPALTSGHFEESADHPDLTDAEREAIDRFIRERR